MKMKWIALLAAALVLAVALFLVVRLATSMVGGLSRTGEAVVDTRELTPWAAPTPDADLSSDQFYDAPDPGVQDETEPTQTPEAMVAVPVEETPEELARDEAA